MRPTKRLDFRPHLLIGWWLFWLAISQTAVNIVVAPSVTALMHFIVLIAAFTAGFFFIRLTYRVPASRVSASFGQSALVSTPRISIKVRRAVYSLSIISTLLLLGSLYLAGAFTTGFVAYFAKLRVVGNLDGSLTGIHLLDTITKVFAFPVSYGLVLLSLGAGVRRFRLALAICMLNFGLFSYLWQVNYPIIHLFWLAFFYLSSRYVDGLVINRQALAGMMVACALLVGSAMNRFGSTDNQLFGAVQRYVVGYHLYGFSFYDFQMADPNSILHAHSFGRSALGFLDQIVDHAARVLDIDYAAASFENAICNNTAVPIGITQGHEVNAFGTLAFTFYRDLGVVGIVFGGLIYGGAIAYSLLNLRRNWMAASIFYMLATTWMMGMMVSPVEQGYFWFCLVFLAIVGLANRRVGVTASPLFTRAKGGASVPTQP